MQKDLIKENYFFKTIEMKKGKVETKYYKVMAGYVIVDSNNKECVIGSRVKECELIHQNQRTVPINNFVNREFKFVDTYMLNPIGRLKTRDQMILDKELCDEFIEIDKPNAKLRIK
jgi:hypothetical protein